MSSRRRYFINSERRTSGFMKFKVFAVVGSFRSWLEIAVSFCSSFAPLRLREMKSPA